MLSSLKRKRKSFEGLSQNIHLYNKDEFMIAVIMMPIFATSDVSIAVSVLLRHILRLFLCMYVTAPMGMTSAMHVF